MPHGIQEKTAQLMREASTHIVPPNVQPFAASIPGSRHSVPQQGIKTVCFLLLATAICDTFKNGLHRSDAQLKKRLKRV